MEFDGCLVVSPEHIATESPAGLRWGIWRPAAGPEDRRGPMLTVQSLLDELGLGAGARTHLRLPAIHGIQVAQHHRDDQRRDGRDPRDDVEQGPGADAAHAGVDQSLREIVRA